MRDVDKAIRRELDELAAVDILVSLGGALVVLLTLVAYAWACRPLPEDTGLPMDADGPTVDASP